MNDKTYTAYTELTRALNKLKVEKKRIFNRINDLNRRIKAIEIAMEEIKPVNSNETISTSYVELAEGLEKKKDKITQLKALLEIVHTIGDENKIFKAKDAKRILLNAGIFKNPRSAESMIYTLIDRSGRFEKIEPGIYKLKD